jgi:S-adenosylmethionine synthetase
LRDQFGSAWHSLVLSELDLSDATVEVVESKGRGHPDTICDALAETLSRNLCREYRERFGRILHHNVDKALLSAGYSDCGHGQLLLIVVLGR